MRTDHPLRRHATGFLAGIGFTVTFVFGSVACSLEEASPTARTGDLGEGIPGSVYFTEVEGMPCMFWIHEISAGDSKDSFSGLTCDWPPR